MMPPWPVLRTGPQRSLAAIGVAGTAARWRHSAASTVRAGGEAGKDGGGGGGCGESGGVLVQGENIRPLFSDSTTTTTTTTTTPKNFTTTRSINTPTTLAPINLAPLALWPLAPTNTTATSTSTTTTTTTVRHLSSVPGPLESRKRTGKRHMADIYSLHAFSAPPDDAPGDLTQWEWLAPTPARPPSLLRKAVTAVADVARLVGGQGNDECTSTAPTAEQADPLVVGMAEIEERVCTAGHRMTVDVYTSVQAYIVEFARAVHLGLCRESEITGFAQRLFGVLAPLRGAGDETADLLLSSLVEHLCEAIRRSKVGRPEDYSSRMWMDLVQLASSLDQAATEARSLAVLMDAMPEPYIPDVAGLVPTVVAALVSAWRAQAQVTSRAELAQSILPFPHLTARTAHILYRFSWSDTVAPVLTEALAQIAVQCNSREKKMLQLAHVAVVAHLPSVRQAMFFDILGQVFGPLAHSSRPYVADLQLCTLLLHQWNSRGYLPRPHLLYTSFYGATRGGDVSSVHKTTLARFVAAIARYLPTKQHVPTLMSFCEALRQQGRLGDLVDSFAVLFKTTNVKVGPRGMAQLASSCNDAETAAALFTLASRNIDRMHGGVAAFAHAWSWKMWAKYVDSMIKRPIISGPHLLTALELRNDKAVARTATEEYGRFIQDVLVKMTHEHRFTGRMRLHYLDRCLAFLRSRKLTVRRDFIACYVHLVMGDLRRGHLGRMRRLWWLRGLVAEHLPAELVAQLDRFIVRCRRLGQGRVVQRMQSSRDGLRRAAWMRGVFERRRSWRRSVFQQRRRVAVGYAEMVWGRRVGVQEAWTLMKNNIRWSKARLRGERFRGPAGRDAERSRDGVVGNRPAMAMSKPVDTWTEMGPTETETATATAASS